MSYRFTGLAGYGTRRSVIDNDAYYLYDTFDNPRAAGAVSGTQAEPVGGVRTVADANGKITISNGLLTFATGGVANDWVYWPSQAHVAGKAFIADFGVRGTNTSLSFGLDASSVATTIRNGITIGETSMLYITGATGLTTLSVTNTPISLAIIHRATAGYFYLFKGGGINYWTLVHASVADAFTEIPEIQTLNTTAGFTVDNVRIPKRLYVPAPYTSDAMTATTTDGNGHPEGGALAGLAYSGVGTPAVAAGARGFSALSGGGLGVSVLECSSPDVIIEVNVTRTSGSAGIIARRVDGNNYIQALHNGTNVIISQVVAGSATTLATTARAYSAGATLKFIVSGTVCFAYYNGQTAGTANIPASTSTNHGIITNDLSGSFDNLIVWPRGSEGQYNGIEVT